MLRLGSDEPTFPAALNTKVHTGSKILKSTPGCLRILESHTTGLRIQRSLAPRFIMLNLHSATFGNARLNTPGLEMTKLQTLGWESARISCPKCFCFINLILLKFGFGDMSSEVTAWSELQQSDIQ